MVVGQTTDSTNRIRPLVTIIISSSNLSSSIRKAARHQSYPQLPCVSINIIQLTWICSSHFYFPLFFFSYEYLGQLLLFIYFIWTAQWNNVIRMGLVNYGPVYNMYNRNSKLYLPFQSPPSCIDPQILLNTSLSNSSKFHSPGCKCIQHSAPYLAIGLITVLYINFRCQWHGLGFRCFCQSN